MEVNCYHRLRAMAKNAVFGGVHYLELSGFLRGGSMKSLPQLWQSSSPRDLFCVQVRKPLSVCTITTFQQTRLATQFQRQ